MRRWPSDQYHLLIEKVWECAPVADVVIVAVVPPLTSLSCDSDIMKLCVCPELEDVCLDIPAVGGVSISLLEIVTVWL